MFQRPIKSLFVFLLRETKKTSVYTTLWKNLIYTRIIVRMINPGQFPPTRLLSRLKISFASLKAWIWTFLSPSNFIFRKKSFSFLWSRNSQFQGLRTVGFLFLSELPSSKKTLLHPRPAVEPQSPNSSAVQPALRLHFWLLYRPVNPPSGVLRLWGSEFWDFVLGCVCVYVCTSLCVLWCFLCSLYHLWVFSRSAMEPLTVSSCLFVHVSAKMASSITLPAPVWGNHSDERARTPWHMHFTSPVGPIRSSVKAVSGLASSVYSVQRWCWAPYTPSRGCWCYQSPPAPHTFPQLVRGTPEFPGGACGCISDPEKGLEKLISCHFHCWCPSLAISPPLLITIIKTNFPRGECLYWTRFWAEVFINIPSKPRLCLWARRQSHTHISI